MLLNMRFINKINKFDLHKIENECILYGKDNYVHYTMETDLSMKRQIKIDITTDDDNDFVVVLSEVDHDEYLIYVKYNGSLYGLINGHDITSRLFKMLTRNLDRHEDIEIMKYKSKYRTVARYFLESSVTDEDEMYFN